MPEQKHHEILEFVMNNPSRSSKEIHDGLVSSMGYATVKRMLRILISEKLIITEGSGRGTKYKTGPTYDLFFPIDVDFLDVKSRFSNLVCFKLSIFISGIIFSLISL